MRRTFVILLSLSMLHTGCNDANAPNCLQSAGEVKTFVVNTDTFNEIEVNDDFIVVIKPGTTQKAEVTVGENLFSDITLETADGKLVISDNNGCRWFREVEFPVVTITTPDLTRIRQNGGGIVRSDDVLNFENLLLISEERTGDFELKVASRELRIVNNDLSNYYISGTVDRLFVGFFAGDGRFEGADLEAASVEVFHRGTNDMVVSAIKELTGRIISNGDVIYTKTIPPLIQVSREGRGELIFKE